MYTRHPGFTRFLKFVVAILVTGSMFTLSMYLPRTTAYAATGTWKDFTNGGSFNLPVGIAVDSSGDMFVTNYNNTTTDAVEEWKSATNTWVDITDGNTFKNTDGIAVDSSGDVFVVESRLNATAGVVEELKNGTSTWKDITYSNLFFRPYGITVDSSGDVFVTDEGGGTSNAVYELKSGTTSWQDITHGSSFNYATGIAVDSSGDVFVTNALYSTSRAVVELKKGTNTWKDITDGNTFKTPSGIAIDSSGDVFVTNASFFNSPAVEELKSGTSTWKDISGNGSFNDDAQIAVDSSGHAYVVNHLFTTTNVIERYTAAVVNAATPSITTQPQGATVKAGATGPDLSVTASVTDGGTLSYQWYSNTANSTSGGSLISGATGATYAAPATTAGTTYYYVVVTNTNKNVNGTKTATVTSNAAKVTVKSQQFSFTTSQTIIPVGQTFTVEGNIYTQNGNSQSPIANAAVTLNGPSGSSWSSGGQSTVSAVYSVHSNQQGDFSTDWSAPTNPGVYTLSATANGLTKSAVVDVTKYITGAVTTQPITTSTSSAVTDTFNNVASPQQSNSNAKIVIPSGTFPQNTPVWVTSMSDASNITPSGREVIAAFGVNFTSSQSPQHPITLTISNANIQPGDVVYKILPNGSYQPITSKVTTGQAVVTFTTDPNFIVTRSVGGSGGGPIPPDIIQASLTESAQVGQKYSATIHEIGGTDPMKWIIAQGDLPPGLTLDNQGIVSGTPTKSGTYTFTVKVTDSNSLSSSKQLVLSVSGSTSTSSSGTGGTESGSTVATPLTITTPTVVPPGKLEQAFTRMLTATGGKAPYTWSIVQGNLPTGLQLNDSTGEISGTTLHREPEILTVKVADGNNATQQKQVVVDALPARQSEIVGELPSLYAQNVPVIVENDAGVETTYMPIWYVMQLLKRVGVTNAWDGKHWHMTTSGTFDLSNIKAGNGNTSTYLNNTLVQMENTVAQDDPSTNKPTTFMPIWYVMQLLNRVGLHSTWNGTTWTVTK